MRKVQLWNHTGTFVFLAVVALGARAQEKVTFPSMDADLNGGKATVLTGYLYRPKGDGPFPAVVSMHGCDGLVEGDGRVKPLYGTWGEILSNEGYIVLLPDSFGSRGHGSLCATRPGSRPVEANRERPRDAYAALSFLSSRPDVGGRSVGLLGQSNGASATMNTIAQGTAPNEMKSNKDFGALIVFYPACGSLNSDWVPRVPMLLLMGESDNFTPPGPCKELLSRLAAKASTQVSSHFYANAHHAFDHPNLPVQVLPNVKLPPYGHSPSVGSNPEARADAIQRVRAFLGSTLR